VLITPGVYTYQVTVSDGLDTASATTTVTILNSAPTAVAIINANVNPGPVTLYGALSSDVDGDVPSYLWTQVSGPPVVISTPTGVDASFTAAAAGVYRFQLAVSDSSSNSSSDQIVIRVNNGASVVPTADAGDNQVCTVGSLVMLDGRRSTTPSGNALTYSWTPTGLFTGSATLPNPTFRPPGPGQYTFQLIVSDAGIASVPATVTVLAYVPGNMPPLAVANKLSPAGFPIVGDTVTLDSTGSLDPEGAPLQYAWNQVSGPTAFLSSPSVAKPTFTPVFSGTYTFQLVVSDGVQQGFPALTSFQVLPTAGTTPVSITPTLMSATLPNGHVLSTTAPISLFGAAFPLPASTGATDTWWEQVLGPAVVFNPSFTGDQPPSGIVQFTPPVAGLYRFRLNAVNFPNHLRSSATLDVVVDSPAMTAPVANAGPAQAALTGQTVTLSSTNSGGTGVNTLYSWTQVSGPPVVLSGPSSPNPTFVPLSAGTYVFSLGLNNLTANQTGTSTTPSLVQVTVTAAPAPGGAGGGGGGGGCGTLGLEPLLLLGLATLIRRRFGC
jgi:hypothetical protein